MFEIIDTPFLPPQEVVVQSALSLLEQDNLRVDVQDDAPINNVEDICNNLSKLGEAQQLENNSMSN